MFTDSPAFSGYSVRDLAEAKKFYGETLGIAYDDNHMGLTLLLAGGGKVFLYQKDDHVPATFTVINFPVQDIDEAVARLESLGIRMERFELGPAKQDETGILRGRQAGMGPDIAWFKDPSGNILSVLSSDQ